MIAEKITFKLNVAVLSEVISERWRQDQKWGVQNHPSVNRRDDSLIGEITESDAKHRCQQRDAAGTLTWEDIALEELIEAVEAEDEQARREELIQLAAVCVAWVECIDRGGAR